MSASQIDPPAVQARINRTASDPRTCACRGCTVRRSWWTPREVPAMAAQSDPSYWVPSEVPAIADAEV